MSRILWLVIETLGSLLSVACVLRAYSHRVHLNPRNPISQFVSALTDWLVMPLRRLVAPTRTMDWASVIAAFVVAVLTALLFFVVVGGVLAPNPGTVLFLAVVWLVRWSVWLVIGLVIVQAILSWVNPYAPLAPAIQQLTQPFLAPIRRVVPLVGGVDLSPLVLIIVLQILLMVVDPAVLPGLVR
ncbi:MAG TPA: YggT family protein [Burkholderiaceae bacterium]|nr:YggT family protein [Burkholderiaceae bacterium]